ncbi:hypothetical protein Lal_00011474 [Lupinus albus]|nr:hypothetical protein Lal_00011474 [Lupinus albus]
MAEPDKSLGMLTKILILVCHTAGKRCGSLFNPILKQVPFADADVKTHYMWKQDKGENDMKIKPNE